CLGDGLHDLREVLLRSQSSEASPWRRRNAIGKGERDGVDRVCSIKRAGKCRGGGVDHIVQRVQRERNVVRRPEDSVSTAHDHFGLDGIGKPNAWREGMFLQWNVVSGVRVNEKYVSLDRSGAWRKVLGEEIRRAGIEVRQAIESLRPRTLEFVA